MFVHFVMWANVTNSVHPTPLIGFL